MAKKLTPASKTLLAAAVAAMSTPEGIVYAPAADANKLVGERAGLVEVNPALTDANGNIAVRATAAGQAEVAKSSAATAQSDTPKQSFQLFDGVEKPVKSRGKIGQSAYPFDQMAVGQAIFIPNTTAKPDAVKSISSTVGSANKRYERAVAVGQTHKFFGVYRGVSPADKTTPGALIFREADQTLTQERADKLAAPKKTRTPAATPVAPAAPTA